MLEQEGTLPGQEQWRWDAAGNPLDDTLQQSVRHNRVTRLNGIQWRYDIHGRTTEKDNGQTRWRYRYDTEHRLTEVLSQPRDRNKPQTQVSFRYDPLGRRISKTRQQLLGGQPTGKRVTTRFLWEGFRLLQEIHDDVPLTYIYSDQESYEPLARIDGTDAPEIFWFHCQPNGLPERMTDSEGQVCWEGQNSAWGKLQRESQTPSSGYSQNLRMQGQYLDRETGLHYNLFRYYDPDSGRFTQQDPIGLAGGINLYQYAPNALGWVDPWGLKCWGTARKDFWKNEAKINPTKYSQRNLDRMSNGLAPKMQIEVFNHKKQIFEMKNVSMEIHHKYLPQRGGSQKAHEIWNLEKATPWGHASMDPYRHTGYDLIQIIKGANSW